MYADIIYVFKVLLWAHSSLTILNLVKRKLKLWKLKWYILQEYPNIV